MISRTLLCMSLMACQGLAGPVGSPGLDGTDGLNGVDGLNGEDGSQYWIIESDTTWSGDMDLWGTIWVKEGVSVTIEAGTRLFFRPGSFLAVQGALVSQGTVTLPIRFEGPSGMTQSQPEVLLTGDVAGASLDQFLASGVNFRVRGNGFDRLSNCTIERGNIHIANRTMPFLIDSCSVRPSAGSVQSAVEAQGVTELKIQDSDIEDANAGVIFWGFQDGALLDMKAVTIRNSVSGVLAYARDVDATQSVNMEDVSISDIATYGIRLEGVALNATRLTVSNTFSQGVYTDHQVQINGGEFSEIDSSCLEQTGEYPLTLTGVTMNECASYAVYGRGDIRVIGSHIENVGRGVYSTYGDVTFDTSTLKGSGYYGLYVANSEKILTVSEATVEDIGTNCVDSRGSLSIRDSAVAHCEGWGVYATYDVAVDGLNVSDVTGSGVGAYYGDMTVKSADISLIGKAGIYLYNGDLQLDGMTGSVIGSDGVYVKGSAFIDNLTLSDVNSDGLDVRGGQLELSASAFQNVGRYFVAADKVSAKITDSSFENAGSMGIRAGSLELTTSTVTGATTGVRVETDSDSKIDHCIISDNSSYGVFGGQTTGMSLDVTDSNIMRNGDQGVRYAREVNGNYIAENNGESGVDDTSSGSLDGVYDTTSLQIDGVDAVMNPADAELSGRGAPP